MRSVSQRMVMLVAAGAATTLIGGGAALAVSDGNYSQERMGCHDQTLDNQNEDNEPEGVNGENCHTASARVDDGSGHTYARVGLRATKEGEFVNTAEGNIDLGPGAAGHGSLGFGEGGLTPSGDFDEGGTPDPASGLHFYFGGDDNLNGGEHDGSDLVGPSPSDGGGIALDVTPDHFAIWLDHVLAGDIAYVLANPLPVVAFGLGGCADGACVAAATSERTAYQGGADTKRNVADYENKTWDPEDCSGESDGPEACDDPDVEGDQDITYWRDREGNVVMQPGIAIYEDPDPQGSPLGFPGYPTTAVYAGSCGVIVGGGGAQAPASPVTNSKGQAHVATGC